MQQAEEVLEKNTCITTIAHDWNNPKTCYENDWLFNAKNYKWTITTGYSSTMNVFYVTTNGNVRTNAVNYSGTNVQANPVVYLNKDLKVIDGNGLAGSPYIISE